MKKEYIIFAVITALSLVFTGILTSCDSHEEIDTSIHPGFVLLDDHSVMDTATYKAHFHETGRQVVGVVFATATDDHPMLAVMLDEMEDTFCDSLMSCGTNTDVSAFNGNSNTISMLNATNDSGYCMCPLALSVQESHYNGQSDYIPSVAEMRLLTSAAIVVNPVIERFGGTPIGIGADEDCWYWTSTEVSGSQTVHSWLCSAVNGGIMETPKTEKHKTRAIVQLNYPAVSQ